MISVVIVEDHKMVADGLEQLINESETVRVAGKCYMATACRRALADRQPDVLLLDIGLPDGNGIDLCIELKRKYPRMKVLLLTSYRELTTITRALDAGADGYVLKNANPDELLEGIHTVASGKRFLCEEADATLKQTRSNALKLTRREMELLHLIAAGLTQPELSDKMCLGVLTIRSYRKSLNVKLGAHNTAQLLQNAKALHLI